MHMPVNVYLYNIIINCKDFKEIREYVEKNPLISQISVIIQFKNLKTNEYMNLEVFSYIHNLPHRFTVPKNNYYSNFIHDFKHVDRNRNDYRYQELCYYSD